MTSPLDEHLFVAMTAKTGRGLFTRRTCSQHDTVFVMRGELRYFASRSSTDCHRYENWVGLGRDRWLDPEAPFVYLNHSCEPNLAICGEREFVALRDIEAGEELTFDYAITEDELHWRMTCHCGTPSCRSTVTAIQLLPTEVMRRYMPYVNPYFIRKHYDHVDAPAPAMKRA